MRSKNSLPVYLILLVGISFFAFKGTNIINKKQNTVLINGMEFPASSAIDSKIVPNKYEKIIRNVMMVLQEIHYSPKNIDDNFSKQIFKEYLAELDSGKDIFLASDIEALRTKFETKIDEELDLKEKATFFTTAGELYKKNLLEAEPLIAQILSKPFDFTVKETINIDPKSKDYPTDVAARTDAWRKKLKLMTIERLSDLMNQNEKAKVKKTQAELEKEAREKVGKIMSRAMEGMKKKSTTDEYFKIFINTITQAFDPHTDYFPPIDQRSFNESMSGSYFGIGAQLREEDGNIKIGPLTPGSPSEKSGELTQGDILIAVAQGDEEPTEVIGYAVQDVVKIIRGKENTEVRLTLKKADGTVKVVKLIRKKLALDGTFAKSVIIKDGDKKVGMIYLPEFYADFENPNGRRCAKDVAIEIEKLKQEGVEGIILDLRNNGGGSLYDVVQMVGLFIPDGPIVQVKDRKGKIQTQGDNDKSVLWDGPLTVMVNEFSASASEIFAAAIQDYKRGIVVGSSSTFGKGTVQRQLPLNFEGNKLLEEDEYGSIKITLQKFYRVNGGSTQLNGVVPDVLLPDTYEYLKFREKDSEKALPWDEISKASFKPTVGLDFAEPIKNSYQRIGTNPAFQAIKTNAALIDKVSDKVYSLNLNDYKIEQKQIKDLGQKIDEALKVRDSLPTSFMEVDVANYNQTKDKEETNKNFLKIISKDIYVNEAVKIIADMVKSKQIAIKN